MHRILPIDEYKLIKLLPPEKVRRLISGGGTGGILGPAGPVSWQGR
jgi:hypothetical protein